MKRQATIVALLLPTAMLLILLVAAIMAAAKPVPPTVLPTPGRMLALVNEERARNGIAPLVLDERLNQSAQLKAEDMDKNHYFAHEAPDGKRGGSYVFETAPHLCNRAGENITDNIHTNDSQSAVTAWINSPPHHAAMLDPENTITGFGIAGTKIVEHFCRPI